MGDSGPLSEAEEARNWELGEPPKPEFDLDRYLAQARGVYAMLNQTERWVAKGGRAYRISEMSVRYKANCLAYLRKRAKSLAMLYQWGQAADIGHTALHMSEMTLDDAERWQDELGDEIKRLGPEEWLETMPLMRRLSDDVLNHEGGTDGD